MADVFISYSRRDKDFVGRLHRGLDDRGKDTWVDWEDIPASAEWEREIQEGIDASHAFLFVLSPDSLGSEVCGREFDHAVTRGKRILPILHRDVDPKEVREEAAVLNWVYLRDDDSFQLGLDQLVRAIETDLDHVKAHTRLTTQAINWERGGEDRARVLRGSELHEAERWLTEAAGKQPAATELQARFVQASRESARRRGRIIFSAVSLALVVAVALAIVALIQRADAVHQSNVAYSRQLDAQAQGQYPTDPELSVLLAVQAARVAPGAATEEALRQALAHSQVRERYTNPAGPVDDALWSPGGSRLLIAEEGRNEAQIVQPGSNTKPVVLPAAGLTAQVGWDGSGREAITGGARVSVWDQSGRLVRSLPAVGLQVALAPSGKMAASADQRGVVRIWDVGSGRQVARLAPSSAAAGPASCLHFSPDGSMVAECTAVLGGNSGGAVTVFDIRSQRALETIPEPGSPSTDVAFSPDSRRIALASSRTLDAPGTSVYDTRTGARLLQFPGAASAVAFSPDGRQLAYATLTGSIAFVYTFKTRTSRPLVGNQGTINSIRFSPDGAYVITASHDGTARVFDSVSGSEVEVLAGHTGPVTDASMNDGDTELATASDDHTARVWATPVPRPQAHYTFTGVGRGAVFSPTGDRVALLGPGGTGAILDGRTLRRLAMLAAPHGESFAGGSWSSGGRWVGTLSGRAAANDRVAPMRAEVYDGRTGRLVTAIATGSPVEAAAFDGAHQLVSASADGQADLWALPSGHHLRMLAPPGPTVQSIAYSATGSRLAIARADGTIELLNTAGMRLRTLHGPVPPPLIPHTHAAIPLRVAFSPNGKLLAAAGAGDAVQLWDAVSGRELRRLSFGSSPFVSVAFSPDSRILAAGDADAAELWQVPSGVHMLELAHANSSAWGNALIELTSLGGVGVGFSRDGRTLVSAGDLALRAWNAGTGELLFDDGDATNGDLSPDGQRLVGLLKGELNLYRCELCGGLPQLLATAKRDTTRGLTAGERALYLRRG